MVPSPAGLGNRDRLGRWRPAPGWPEGRTGPGRMRDGRRLS